MERLFQIIAAILMGFAAFFLWRSDNEAMFVAAVIAAVSFFVSVRLQVKERVKNRDPEKL